MPLINSIVLSNDLQILIWHIEESLEELFENIKLTSEDLNRLKKRKKVINQKGFLAIRNLFLSADINTEKLFYNSMGAPVLKSGKKLSISHSQTVAGIAYGSKPVGFDFDRSLGRRNKNSEVAGHGVSLWFETVGVLLKSLRS